MSEEMVSGNMCRCLSKRVLVRGACTLQGIASSRYYASAVGPFRGNLEPNQLTAMRSRGSYQNSLRQTSQIPLYKGLYKSRLTSISVIPLSISTPGSSAGDGFVSDRVRVDLFGRDPLVQIS